MEDRARRDLRAQREADPDREVDRAGVDDRERARQAEADRADVHVGRIAEREVTAAEHLGPGLELDVDLQPDHRLVAAHVLAPPASKPIAPSRAWAASSIRFSLNAGPASWNPTGSPSLSPDGIEIAGIPASGIGTVQKSLRYIASGSAVLAPSSNAVQGLVGVTTKS